MFRSLSLTVPAAFVTVLIVHTAVDAGHAGERGPLTPAVAAPVDLLAADGTIDQTISVTIPRTALVKVDGSGVVVAAATNTGEAPCPGDDVYLILPDGTVVQSMTFDVSRVRWAGDFTSPGVYQSQN